MANFPSAEAILLEIHQSLGRNPYQTKKKEKFAALRGSLASHNAMGVEVLDAIFDGLGMDPQARLDALSNFEEFGNSYKELELNTWSFDADLREITWMLLGYFLVPGLARHVAFWNLASPLDTGMPGGRFWYLPEIRELDGVPSIYMPVAQVVDWLLDLLGMPLEEFAGNRGLSTGDSEDRDSEKVLRSLYNWRKETNPNPGSFAKYFPDNMTVPFRGTFDLDSKISLGKQFDAALDFVKRKNLTAEKLRIEIPMTQEGRLEAILAGTDDAKERAEFVARLADRYAAPSSLTIRQRLVIARMVQDGYVRLLKFVCPGVGRLCADPQQNKLLQLFSIYKLVYNTTIDAWRFSNHLGEGAEDMWFEEHLPPWDKLGLFLSILPSRRKDGVRALGELLTRHFASVTPNSLLEDHRGLDKDSVASIVERNMERLRVHAEELKAEIELSERLKTSSAWRTLQDVQNFWVVSQVAQQPDLRPRARQGVFERLRELATSPSEALQVVLFDLHRLLNGERSDRPKDARVRVQVLIEEATASPAYEIWEAPLLQYKAKHRLACNDFEGAGKLFKEALEAGRKRCYGPLRGEVARDCLAVEVANRKLVANNAEMYYRVMLAEGIMTDCEEIPGIEDTARWASDYFWDTLYKPYRDVEVLKPLLASECGNALGTLLQLVMGGKQEDLPAWVKTNRRLLQSGLPDVNGDSVLMLLLKMRSSLAQALPRVRAPSPAALHGELPTLESALANWRKSVGVLIQHVTKKQLDLADLKMQTPLMLVAEAGDTELVKILLNAGADPDVQDWRGMTALHSAMKSCVDGCVDALLAHPCRLDNVTIDGRTVLHTAAWATNLYAVKRLLELTPELAWKKDVAGMTPLEVVELLVEHTEAREEHSLEFQRNGGHCLSKSELEKVVRVLQQAPVPANT